jgi:hypothetical protein
MEVEQAKGYQLSGKRATRKKSTRKGEEFTGI